MSVPAASPDKRRGTTASKKRSRDEDDAAEDHENRTEQEELARMVALYQRPATKELPFSMDIAYNDPRERFDPQTAAYPLYNVTHDAAFVKQSFGFFARCVSSLFRVLSPFFTCIL